MKFIDCGHGNDVGQYKYDDTWMNWTSNADAIACFVKDGDFSYGVYQEAVELTTKDSIITRYTYSLFWGFQVAFYHLFVLVILFILNF